MLQYGSVEVANRQIAYKLIRSLKSQSLSRPASVIDSGESDFVPPDVRYCWNLNVGVTPSGYLPLRIRPAVQKILRSGEWGRPRELALKAFSDAEDSELTAVDEQMVPFMKQGQAHLDMVGSLTRILEILTGYQSFMINLEPCRLEKGTIEILVNETEGLFTVEVSPSQYEREARQNGCSVECVVQSSLILVWNRTEGVARWYSCRQKEVRLIQHLRTSSISVPRSEWPGMLAELKEISTDLLVRFPPSVNLIQRKEQPSFVLLLRLKRGAFLHAVICIRDETSRLIAPGDGRLVRFVQEDGQEVQLIRDPAEEQRQAKELASAFDQSYALVEGLNTWKITSEEDVVKFLERAAELTQAEKLSVVWHKGSASKLEIIGRVSASNVRVQIERQRDWFGVNGSCTVGNQTFTLQQLLDSMQNSSAFGMIELTPGKWVSITEELRKAIGQLADSTVDQRGKLRIDATAALNLNNLEDVGLQLEADKHWRKCLERVRDLEDFNPELPSDLKCELREYQREGFQWLSRLAEWGVGGILADDMGLGKTVQTLAVLLRRKDTGPALVIAPLSLGYNWVNETQRFAPSLKPLLLRDADRAELLENTAAGQIVICSYGLALREVNRLRSVKWGTLVLDEAQNIKNSNSQTSKAVRTIEAEWKLALTGTPIENHLGELWSIFAAVAPGVLGPWDRFRNRFAAPIEKDNNQERREALNRQISPFILRRTKATVLSDLPDRNEMNLLVDLSPEERSVYDAMRVAAISELGNVENSTTNSGEQRLRILQILIRLRQLACHVGLVDSAWKGSSSKLELLMEKLSELKEGGHRALIFSQFTTHLGFVREACEKNGFSYLYLDGQTPPARRQESVEAFQAGQADVFLISLKAGGTGLNLTAPIM